MSTGTQPRASMTDDEARFAEIYRRYGDTSTPIAPVAPPAPKCLHAGGSGALRDQHRAFRPGPRLKAERNGSGTYHLLVPDPFLDAAIDEAGLGLAEGGIPIGSVLVLDGQIMGRGHNRRVQKGSPILHGEMDALENAGRLLASEYRRSVIYTTLSPCHMCTGAILLYEIPKVVIGENRTFWAPKTCSGPTVWRWWSSTISDVST